MVEVRAFKGVRANPESVEKIAELPYDVYSGDEARNIVSKRPDSFMKIDRAETMFPKDTSPYETKVYEKARDELYKMIKKGDFIQDEEPKYYLYTLIRNGRSQIGLVATCSIDDYLDNVILKHELTREEKEKDRINHVDYCDANTGPIFLTYKNEDKIDKIINKWIDEHDPVYDFKSEDGIRHIVHIVDNKDVITDIRNAFKQVKNLYIADGHHRCASAVKVGMKRRQENPNYKGNEEFNYFLAVIFPHNQLKILEYNRLVKDLNENLPDDFILKVKEDFELKKSGNQFIQPEKKGQFSLYLEEKWYLFEIKSNLVPKDCVESLDVSILQNNIFDKILNIKDPRTDDRIKFVGGIRGYKEIEKEVKEGMAAGFVMYPTSIEELIDVADNNLLMPPKSTWFEPKLRSGIFVHLLK